MTGKRVDEIIKNVISNLPNFEFPCLVFNKQGIVDDYKKLIQNLKKTKIHYALKANSEIKVLDVLKKENTFFEIASEGELKKLESLNVKGSHIIFSNPISNTKTIKKAYSYGVNYFSFHTLDHYKRLLDHAPNAIHSLRIYITDIAPNSIDSGMTLDEIKKEKRHFSNFQKKVTGLCFHMSKANNILKVLERCEYIIEKEMNNIKVINIGGCFNNGNYSKDFFKKLNEKIGEMINKYNLEFYAEPGRGLTFNNSVFFAKVQALKINESKDKAEAYVDMGSSSIITIDKNIKILQNKVEKKIKFCTFRSLLCNNKILFKAKNVPAPNLGSIVCLPYSGAYLQKSDFHSFENPKIYII